MKIALTSSELAPFAKTGGLADVSTALAVFLHEAGHEVRVFVPRYARIDAAIERLEPVPGVQGVKMQLGRDVVEFSLLSAPMPGSDLPIHFIDCPQFYARPGIYSTDPDEHLRFLLLSRATIESCQRMGFAPQVFHCNDWQTALVPLYLKTLYAWDEPLAHSRSLLTIHNLGYQGIFSAQILADTGLEDSAHLFHQEDLEQGRINFLKTGILYADAITTVSSTYAREIQSEEYGMGLDGLLRERTETVVGILNGVDYGEWDPETDPHLKTPYSASDWSGKETNKRELLTSLGLPYERDSPVIGIISRMAGQKGFDLLYEALPELLRQRRFSLVVLGSGEHQYEEFFSWLQHRFPHQVCFYNGFSSKLAHMIEAGSDMFLMPSRYEPCGLNQMYSLRYGTIPIVRRTGGLADTVQLFDPDTGQGNGIVFDRYEAGAVAWAIGAALDLYAQPELWAQMMRNAMAADYSWERQGQLYLELYERLCAA